MGSFVPRLLALTIVWLLATAALTFAAAQRMSTAHPAATTTAATAAFAPRVLVVPDVRRQAYVFAKGTLGDAGFAWRVEGAVQGFASNTVVTQSPAAGSRVVDTGAPLVVLHLARAGKQAGVPEAVSPLRGTAVRLADLASAPVTPAVHKTAKTAAKPKPVEKPKPSHKRPQQRPPAFVVPGARREPLDEMPLTNRAKLLLRFIDAHPRPSDANVKHWLYQHAWIVAGAQMGWWHGADALRMLVTVDRHVWELWGIGARSEAVARQALAEVEARSS